MKFYACEASRQHFDLGGWAAGKKKKKHQFQSQGSFLFWYITVTGGAKDLFPQLMKAQSEMLPRRFSWQVQISLIDIKAVMIILPPTRWRTTLARHVPAATAWQGCWIYGKHARLCPNLCIATFFWYPLEHTAIRMDHALEGDLIFMNSSR